MFMRGFEAVGALVTLGVTHDLKLQSVASEIVENQILALLTVSRDTPSDRNCFFKESVIWDVAVLLDKLLDRDLDFKLVGIRMVILIILEVNHCLASVFKVSTGI